jgi:hypothetical protein
MKKLKDLHKRNRKRRNSNICKNRTNRRDYRNFFKRKGRENSKKSKFVLYNHKVRFLAIAKYRKDFQKNKQRKIEYLIEQNYTNDRINPRLSSKDYFISILKDIFRMQDLKEFI